MRVKVKVVTRASRNAVEKISDESFRVWVTEVPERGKANERVRELLAMEFGVSKTVVRLTRGQTSSQKVFEIG